MLSPTSGPQPRGLAPGRRAPEHLALKVSGAWLQKLHRTGENRDFTLKEHTQNFRYTRPRAKAVIWQEPGTDLMLVLEGLLGRFLGDCGPPWGHKHCWQMYQGIFICVNSPGGWHFGTKTWPHLKACRLQCCDTSGQTKNWARAQPHSSADRLSKDFLSPQQPLDTPLEWPCPPEDEYPAPPTRGQVPASPVRKPAQASRPVLPTRGQTPEARKLQSSSVWTKSTNTGQTLPWDQLAPSPCDKRGVHCWDT